jgi:hypothetical protein
MKLKKLEDALLHSWKKDTCFPGMSKEWDKDNPAYGQCLVSALIVQDYLGGDLVFSKKPRHYWNRINGKDVDLTRNQFPDETKIIYSGKKYRNIVLKGHVKKRYDLLKARVEEYLNN